MRSTIMVAILVLLEMSAAFGQVASRPSRLETLWLAHSYYQLHRQHDLITPIMVRGLLRQLDQNNISDAAQFIRAASDLKRDWEATQQYAASGHLPDPFARERAFLDWLRQTPVGSGKHALARTLIDGSSAALAAGSVISDQVTRLDSSSQLALKDLIARASDRDFDKTFLRALRISKTNHQLKNALETLLKPAGISLDDAEREIERKSPELMAAINSREMKEMLASSGKLDQSGVDKSLAKNLSTITSAMRDRAQVLDGKAPLQVAAESLEVQRVRVEAAHAAVYLIGALVAANDAEAGARIHKVGNALASMYSATVRYQENVIRLTSAGSGLGMANVVLFGDWVGAIVMIGNALSGQKTADQVIIEQLNNIQDMLLRMQMGIANHFARLELILDATTRTNLEYFNALLVQGAITGAGVNQLRTSSARILERIDQLDSEARSTERRQINREFRDLQRRCYLGDKHLRSSAPITQDAFDTCLRRFFAMGVEIAAEAPFSLPAGGHTVAAFGNPPYVDEYSAVPLLLTMRTANAMSVSPGRGAIVNPAVWSNAVLAYLATVDLWPEYRSRVNKQQLQELLAAGRAAQAAIDSMFDPNRPSIFAATGAAVEAGFARLTAAMTTEVDLYSSSKTAGVSPFADWESAEAMAPAVISFVQFQPRSVPLCKDSPFNNPDPRSDVANWPSTVRTPPDMMKDFPGHYALLATLSPEHRFSFCYDFWTNDTVRFMVNDGKPHCCIQSYATLQPLFSIEATAKDMNVYINYLFGPATMRSAWPFARFRPDHDRYRELGTFTPSNMPPEVAKANANPLYAFSQFLNWVNDAEPPSKPITSWSVVLEPDDQAGRESAERRVRELERLQELHADSLARGIDAEFGRDGALRSSLHALQLTLAAQDAIIRLGYQNQVVSEGPLAKWLYGDERLYIGDTGWYGLTPVGRQFPVWLLNDPTRPLLVDAAKQMLDGSAVKSYMEARSLLMAAPPTRSKEVDVMLRDTLEYLDAKTRFSYFQ